MLSREAMEQEAVAKVSWVPVTKEDVKGSQRVSAARTYHGGHRSRWCENGNQARSHRPMLDDPA
jgi:hypothetical protein